MLATEGIGFPWEFRSRGNAVHMEIPWEWNLIRASNGHGMGNRNSVIEVGMANIFCARKFPDR